MTARARVLVTNDDGVAAPGLHRLAAHVRDAGHQVVVAAPEEDESGCGTSRAVAPDGLVTTRVTGWEGLPGVPVHTVGGPPGLIVTAACQGAFGPAPDLVLAGINPGANVGPAVLHSGTVGAVLTAAHHRRPAIAVSRHTPAIGKVYLLGEKGRAATAHGVHLLGVPHIVRRLLGHRSPWPDGTRTTRIAVVAGGGGHADAPGFLAAALHGIRAHARRHGTDGIDALVLTGPHFDGTVDIPPGMPGPVRVAPDLGPTYDIYRHATAAITHAGYNTVQELARSRVPTVVVPGIRDFDDQHVHLRAAASRLNVAVTCAEGRTIARALTDVLHHRPPTAPGPGAATPPEADGAAWLARDLASSAPDRRGVEDSHAFLTE